MVTDWLLEPLRAYLARKRWERQHYETAALLLRGAAQQRPMREAIDEDPDAQHWRLTGQAARDIGEHDLASLRDKARYLADHNPHARNILHLHRDYVVGVGMRHEIVVRPSVSDRGDWGAGTGKGAETVRRVTELWRQFLEANDWTTGNRKDWEFCLRTWRDGECFLRLFRQPTWPPRMHFIDPEHVAPDPRTGLPAGGIETLLGNVEAPVAYCVCPAETGRTSAPTPELVDAALVLHAKIGVDANVKRGVTLLLPVLDSLKRFQGWLDVELIQRKVASSIALVRKHHDSHPDAVSQFADAQATSRSSTLPAARRVKIEPGSIIDAQGFDLEFLAPNTHFEDASLLGRTILLAIAAGTGLPEFMLSADASNGNYASTLVAEGPAVRHFAAWQSYFIGQWQKLFSMAMREALRLGLVSAEELAQVELRIVPPPLAVRNRHADAQADAIYFDRGALSARELARRDHVDPEQMRRERADEDPLPRATEREVDHA